MHVFKQDNIVSAFMVAKSTYVPCEKVESELIDQNTPEKIVMSLEHYNELKPETQSLISLIEKLPDSFFIKKTGELKKTTFLKYCRSSFGWKLDKLERMSRELARVL